MVLLTPLPKYLLAGWLSQVTSPPKVSFYSPSYVVLCMIMHQSSNGEQNGRYHMHAPTGISKLIPFISLLNIVLTFENACLNKNSCISFLPIGCDGEVDSFSLKLGAQNFKTMIQGTTICFKKLLDFLA